MYDPTLVACTVRGVSVNPLEVLVTCTLLRTCSTPFMVDNVCAREVEGVGVPRLCCCTSDAPLEPPKGHGIESSPLRMQGLHRQSRRETWESWKMWCHR